MTDFALACIKANEEIAIELKYGISSHMKKSHQVGAGGDVSTELDLFAEKIFVKHLGIFGTIESEESGIIGSGDATIILDPIDGSANALSNFPYYGTSVAYINLEGVLETAIVCNLSSGDIFIKDGKNSIKYGKLYDDKFDDLNISYTSEIGLFEKAYSSPVLVSRLKEAGLKFRSPGATALSLAYAHSVSFFIFLGSARIYDIAAGLALCEDLEVIVEDEYVIVSKSKDVAKKIETIILRSQL